MTVRKYRTNMLAKVCELAGSRWLAGLAGAGTTRHGRPFVWPGWPGPTMGRKGFCSSCLPPSKSSTHNTHLTRWPKHFDCISQKKPTHKFLSCHDDMTQHSFTDHQTSAQSIFSPWNTETTSEHESGYYEQNENLIFNSFVFLDSWMISIVDCNDIIRSGSWGRALERV